MDCFKTLEGESTLARGRSTVDGLAQAVYIGHCIMLYCGSAALWKVRRDLKLRLVSGQTCLVPRDMQIPYPITVNLVEGLGVSQVRFIGVGTFFLFRNMSGSRSSNHADEAVSESSQNKQSKPIKEAIPRPEQATHRLYGEVEQEIKAELFLEKLNDIYDTLKYEDSMRVTFAAFRQRKFGGLGLLKLALAPLPPMEFAAAAKAATRTEMADQAVIQRKTAIGSTATPYKCHGQRP
ncbi:hypothetical protein M9H77_12621 [Catharanthus roseus]|uniref:Uncharacterized protein n=1 Tax=Catharanthus roseus TaxID=4058 RepID=A0ACC0BI03_CATRO|nr:hypothetical protein M9H77_12621 [Catharanthus roseus]